jgi:outer membrane putative beta-barrel porin/alpha-amylase
MLSRAIWALLLFFAPTITPGQELQPRAYLPVPVGLNFLSVNYSRDSGGLLFDPSLPVEDAHVSASVAAVSFGESLDVFGRSGQVLAVLPYVVADLSARVGAIRGSRHRSGLADSTFRFAMNLHGAPAMHLKEFARYRPKTLVGVSLTVMPPTGQYDRNVLINIGTNRWAFKPELGISRFTGKWEFEAAFGVWLYTRNSRYYGGTFQMQDPLGSIQAHVVRELPHRTWLALDGTFYTGGRSYVGNTVEANYEGNTRFGATFGIAVGRRQAVRFAYFDGATTRIGSDISSISVAYQVIWQKGR